MNFFSKFSSAPRAAAKPPKAPKGPRLVAVWTVDPRTGKPRRSWRLASDADGSCRRRPGGPPHRGRRSERLRPR
jgi:hypothetical protein